MGINIEIARQKLYSSYGVDVDKYSKDETVDEFEKKLDSILSFGFNSILPVIITGTIALLSAVVLSYFLHSAVFGVLFFLSSILIFLLGIGALSIAKATENLYDGICFILAFSTNITSDIRDGIIKNGKFNMHPKDLALLVLYGVVFPIVKKIIRKKPLGGIVYFVIEKVVNRGFGQIIDKNSETETVNSVKNKNGLLTVSEKVKNFSKSALKSIIIILNVFGIIFISLGVMLILILFVIFAIL
jgi:hypothetical protein